MHLAVRPWITAGVALAGMSVIADGTCNPDGCQTSPTCSAPTCRQPSAPVREFNTLSTDILESGDSVLTP